MHHAMLLSWKPGLTRDQQDGALMRRAEWKYPDGMQVHAEWWQGAGSPAVIVLFEADDFAPIMEVTMTWGDVFDITTHPAIPADQGLMIGPEVMARRG